MINGWIPLEGYSQKNSIKRLDFAREISKHGSWRSTAREMYEEYLLSNVENPNARKREEE
jgi:hypothetical protein